MSDPIDPEIAVLDVLIGTCQTTRRLNASLPMAEAVLLWEKRLVAAREKRARAVAPAAAATSAEGVSGDAALAA